MTPAQAARAIFAAAPPQPIFDGMDTSVGFLQSLFAGQDRGYAVLFALPAQQSAFFDLSESDWPQQIAGAATRLRDRQDVYVGICTQRDRLNNGRGTAASVIAMPGLWADIDVRGPNHSSPDLPGTLDEAWSILDSVPFKPTIAVHSGGGLQVYWLFREPFEITTDAERNQAKTLTTAFLAHLQRAASQRGWRIDAVADLARVFRLPGSFNRKQAVPVPITHYVAEGEPRYNLSDFEEFLSFESDPSTRSHVEGSAPSKPRADINRIVAGCSWMRHCKDDAATLPEPEWYRMVSVLSRCRDGRQAAHAFSQPYPDYTSKQTDEKFDHAFQASGPPTCVYIGTSFPGYCGSCAHRGRVKSPVVLGFPPKRLQPPNEPPPAPDPFAEAESRIEAAITANDISQAYRIIDKLAALPDSDLLVIVARLQKNFGREFRSNDFKRAIKEKRSEQKRARLKVNELPPIIVNTQWIRDTTAKALPALHRANYPPSLFVRSGEMVHVAVDEEQRPSIFPASESYLRGRLDRAANFLRATDDTEAPIPVPLDVVRDILALHPSEWGLPPLRSVVEVPSIRPDGTIIEAPGYDARSALFYAPAANLTTIPVPESPDGDDVDAAFDLIEEAIGEFPYSDASSKANAIGLLLTPVVRTAIQGCTPLALIDAPKAGTGKSLFVDVLSMIVSGRPAPMTPFPRNDEEMAKQIGACLMAGRPIICFDNLEGTLQAPSLALAITAKEYEARILGFSRNMTMPNNATWIVTGNNIRPSGDMPRRCYQIRLDARMSNPAIGRTFRHPDLLGWVRENRARLLHALLVIARAWYATGRINRVDRALGSFEDWHRTVGSILANVGVDQFLATAEEFVREADEVAIQWEAFLLEIADRFTQPFTAAELVKQIDTDEELRNALPDRLKETLAKRSEALISAIGQAFGKRRDQRFGDLGVYLKRSIPDTHRKTYKWQVVVPGLVSNMPAP